MSLIFTARRRLCVLGQPPGTAGGNADDARVADPGGKCQIIADVNARRRASIGNVHRLQLLVGGGEKRGEPRGDFVCPQWPSKTPQKKGRAPKLLNATAFSIDGRSPIVAA
jgi:hypothetical protein